MGSSSNSIVLRRASIDDIDALKQFYLDYFSDKPILTDMKIWNWSFAANPNQHAGLPFLVIEDSGVIKGGIGYLSVNFIVNNHLFNAGHPVNFFVAPDYKGLPALRLFRSATSENQIGYASYFSPDAEKLVAASKWVNLSKHLHNYYFPFGASSLLKVSPSHYYQHYKKIARMTWVSLLNFYLKMRTSTAHCTIERDDQFSDKLFPADYQPPNTYCGVKRDITYIKWRYAESPRLHCMYFSLDCRGKRLALAVVQFDEKHNQAIILDVIDNHCEAKYLQLMFIEMIKFFKSKHATKISTSMLNVKMDKILRSIGFGVSRSNFGLMFYTKDSSLKSNMSDPNHWDFWIGHSDVY